MWHKIMELACDGSDPFPGSHLERAALFSESLVGGCEYAEDGCDPHPLPCFFLKKSTTPREKGSREKFRKARGEVWGLRRRRDRRGDPVMSSVEFPTW